MVCATLEVAVPHEVTIDGERFAVRDVVDVGRLGDRPLLRLHHLASGDTVVIAPVGATCDGVPLLGKLGVIPWGTGALLRAERRRIEVVWRSGDAPCVARAEWRCRLCFAGLAAGEPAVRCTCMAVFHTECAAARITCPGCGAAAEGTDS